MSSDVVSVDPETDVTELIDVMLENKVSALPVVDEASGDLLGIVSYVDGRPQSVFTIEVDDARIRAIYIVTNPEKLSHLPPPPF